MRVIARFLFPAILMAFLACEKRSDDSMHLLNVNDFEEKLHAASEKILLDVRTMPEYQRGHLANSILMDVQGDDFELKIKDLDKSTPIFVYCASGIRSGKAAKILSENGFTSIYHMDGGLQEWVKENKQIVRN